MLSLSDNNQAVIIKTLNSTSRYLAYVFNIDNPYLEHILSQLYPTELWRNEATFFDAEDPFTYLYLSKTNNIVSSKM